MKFVNSAAIFALFAASASADQLHVITHVANTDSDTGFSVAATLYENGFPSMRNFMLHYDAGYGPESVSCGSEVCFFDIFPNATFEVLSPTIEEFDVNISGAGQTFAPSEPTSTLIVSPSNSASSIDQTLVQQSLVNQFNRDADRVHYQFDALSQRRIGWEMRSGESLQQVSLMSPNEWPVSVNLGREQVGVDSRSRVDLVLGQAWRQGDWNLAVLGSVGAGRLNGATSRWYGAGVDAWFGQGSSGPFVRVSQQFSEESGRVVGDLRLSDWQDQSTMMAAGWRVKQRIGGLNWDGNLGFERSTHRTVGMVGDGNQWQAITAIPDQQGAYVAMGVGSQTRFSSWRVGIRQFRDESQVVLNWGW